MDAQLRTFFGKQLPLFPEAETPVTSEEDQAFAELDKKLHKQVGGDHYFNPIQPWDIIRAWDLNYWEGNIVKYTLRHKGKGKVEDLEKARHYLDYLIENYDELFSVSK
jgi:hypothetical protein